MAEIPAPVLAAAALAIHRAACPLRDDPDHDCARAAAGEEMFVPRARAALEAAAPLLAEAWGVVIRAETDDGNGPAEVEIIYFESWRSEAWDDTVPSRPGWQVRCSVHGPLRSPQWRHDWAYETRGVAQMVATRHLRSKHAGGAP